MKTWKAIKEAKGKHKEAKEDKEAEEDGQQHGRGAEFEGVRGLCSNAW